MMRSLGVDSSRGDSRANRPLVDWAVTKRVIASPYALRKGRVCPKSKAPQQEELDVVTVAFKSDETAAKAKSEECIEGGRTSRRTVVRIGSDAIKAS